MEVQTDDFENATLTVVIGCKPFLAKGLRKFKHFRYQVSHFVVGPVHRIKLKLERGQSVTKFHLLFCKCFGIDLAVNTKVDYSLLLTKGPRNASYHEIETALTQALEEVRHRIENGIRL